MTPWTAFFHSVHSSLIDELNERFPDSKPELKMPVRFSGFAYLAGMTQACLSAIQIRMEGEPTWGYLTLAWDANALQTFQNNPNELWSALLRRAGSEFSRRGIQPQFEVPRLISLHPDSDPYFEWPKAWPTPEKTVWVPFLLQRGTVSFGLSV